VFPRLGSRQILVEAQGFKFSTRFLVGEEKELTKKSCWLCDDDERLIILEIKSGGES
jgi:hypothetical protein